MLGRRAAEALVRKRGHQAFLSMHEIRENVGSSVAHTDHLSGEAIPQPEEVCNTLPLLLLCHSTVFPFLQPALWSALTLSPSKSGGGILFPKCFGICSQH